MYFARLHDSICEDFPKVIAIVGQEKFSEIIKEYLRVYPPSSFSLRFAGERMVGFLNSHSLTLQYPFLAELARLEYAFIESFDAADANLLTSETLQQTPPQLWGELFFQLIPAAQLKSFHWQVDRLWENETCCADELTGLLKKTDLMLWRQDYEVKYRRLDSVEAELLPLVARGIHFAELCERTLELLPADQAITTLGGYVQKWLSEGLIALPMPSE